EDLSAAHQQGEEAGCGNPMRNAHQGRVPHWRMHPCGGRVGWRRIGHTGDHITSFGCSPIVAESSVAESILSLMKPVSTYSVASGFLRDAVEQADATRVPTKQKSTPRLGDDQLVTRTPSRCVHNGHRQMIALRDVGGSFGKPEAETPAPSPGRELGNVSPHAA